MPLLFLWGGVETVNMNGGIDGLIGSMGRQLLIMMHLDKWPDGRLLHDDLRPDFNGFKEFYDRLHARKTPGWQMHTKPAYQRSFSFSSTLVMMPQNRPWMLLTTHLTTPMRHTIRPWLPIKLPSSPRIALQPGMLVLFIPYGIFMLSFCL